MADAFDDTELVVVTMVFDALDVAAVGGLLSRYVVMSRAHEGCRNIDLCRSVTQERRFVVISKWDSPATQRAHFDSDELVRLAESLRGLLRSPPVIDLLESISAHDLH
jgi:quinol monooxygenase YgiN